MLSILTDEQTTRFQGAWDSYYTTMNIARKFMTMLADGAFAKPSDVFRHRDFPFLMENIKKPEVLKVTADYISRICRVYDDIRRNEGGGVSQAFGLNTRVVLSAYPSYLFPQSVFETIGMMETGVQTAATEFITSLETIAEALAKGTRLADIPDMASFGPKIHEFATRFNEFKESDMPNIQGRIERAIIILSANRARLTPDSAGYTVETGNINRMRDLLAQQYGPEALDALDARMMMAAP